MKFTDPNGEFGFLIFVGLSALMSAVLSGSQPDGSFDWGEAGKGALIGAAMPVGMMGSVLAPYAPALLGVSGALGSAALAGGAMFGSVTLTTGATSFATNGTFSPNLKAAGISAGITALFAGIEGGIRAANDERNFWTGEKIEVWEPTPVERLRMQTPKFKIELKFKTTLTKMKSLFSHSELHFTNNNEITIYEYYLNGNRTLHSRYNAWSGGVNPLPESQFRGMTPRGVWEVTNIRINKNFTAPFVRDEFGFKAQLHRLIDDIPIFRQPNTFLIHPDGNLFGSNGCPVLQVGASELENFANYIQRYLSRYGTLRLYVY